MVDTNTFWLEAFTSVLFVEILCSCYTVIYQEGELACI